MERYHGILQDKRYKKMLQRLEEYEANREFCCHTLEHFCDVARLMYIMSLEDGNCIPKDLIYATALLHDLGRVKEYEENIPHHTAGQQIARDFLMEYGYNNQEIKDVLMAIGEHRSAQNKTHKLSYYLYSADKLSRNCFHCSAWDRCKWSIEKKNRTLIK